MTHTRTLTIALTTLILSGTTLAAAGPEKGESQSKDLLRGPKVVTTSTRHERKDAMSDHAERKNAKRDAKRANEKRGAEKNADHRPIFYGDYVSAIRRLNAPRGAQSLGLTPEQQDEIHSIAKAYREALKEYKDEHIDKIRKIQAEMKSTRRSKQANSPQAHTHTDRNKANRENDAPSTREPQNDHGKNARMSLRKFLQEAPMNREALAKLKRVLTPEQQDMVKAKIHQMRARGASRARRARSADEPQTTRSNARKHINPNRVRHDGQRDANRAKRTKDNAPPSDD